MYLTNGKTGRQCSCPLRTTLRLRLTTLKRPKRGANAARQAIEDLGVEADTLTPGSEATVVKSTDPETGAVTLTFGIPKGDKGDRGADGEQGQKGDTGERGPAGEDGFSPVASVSK